MKEERLYILVEKELEASLSEAERTELQQWLGRDGGNQAAYDEVKTILVSAGEIFGQVDPQTDAQWAALQASIEEEEVEAAPAVVIPMRRKRFTWVAVAAAVVILAVVGFFMANPSGSPVDPGNAPLA